jgi:site-specific recombinase XerD
MRIEDATSQFLDHLLLERGCSSATAEAYASDVRKLQEYLAEEGIEPVTEALSPIVVRRYVSWLATAGYSPATIRRRVYAISSLFKWAVSYGYADSNPCASVVLPKKEKKMPAVLSAQEARRVLKAAEKHSNARLAFRNRAIIAIFLFCGLRRAELVGLDLDDVDLRARWVRVRRGKGGKGRSVPLVEEAGEAVADWLEFRPAVDHEALFVGIHGERLKVGGVAKVFNKAAAKADVDREGVSLHTLRHTFASLLLQEGCDLVSIQELLGHADLASTSIYLHMDASHLQSAVSRHPLTAQAPAPS